MSNENNNTWPPAKNGEGGEDGSYTQGMQEMLEKLLMVNEVLLLTPHKVREILVEKGDLPHRM